ncbi:MAG: YbaN family protein [Rhodocyclaceae bacterium]|jgi:uncharacterized membrane protein YbaN (DUF454 family)|nr:YbaN family protein [Rhodocyclaceae bacterium]
MIEPRLHASPTLRAVFWCGGTIALALGVIGAFLPVLPTTPFVLLAAYCYSRASVRFHRMILENRLFGPVIHQWHASRTIPPKAKGAGLILMTLSFATSIVIVQGRPGLQVFLAVLGLGLGGWLARIPTREVG